MPRNRFRLLLGASTMALSVCVAAQPVVARQAPATTTSQTGPAAEAVSEGVVTGVREGLRSAQAIKRNADQIVDSVQAQDIGKLPDANTTEALL